MIPPVGNVLILSQSDLVSIESMPLQSFHLSTIVEHMYERTYTWRAGSMGPVLRRIPIYRVTTLPNGNEVEHLLVCEMLYSPITTPSLTAAPLPITTRFSTVLA